MSTTGCWGSSLIVYLHSDGKRRHKKWCDYYEDAESFCRYKCEKCCGSAFCEHYKDGAREEEPIWTSKIKYVDPPRPANPPKQTVKVAKCEFYRLATRGEHLLGKTVMVRNTPHTFRIGIVIEDSFDYFSVDYEGRVHKYEKRRCFSNNALYIYTGENYYREYEDHIDEDWEAAHSGNSSF